MSKVYTITHNTDDESMPWVGLHNSLEAALTAIVEYTDGVELTDLTVVEESEGPLGSITVVESDEFNQWAIVGHRIGEQQ